MYPTQLICLIIFLILSFQSFSFFIGDATVQSLSEKNWQKIKTYLSVSNDLTKKSQLVCVSRQIIRQLGTPFIDYDWDIELFDNPDANAFALAGGKIGVYTGIFDLIENEDELAAIIGHEIAHITKVHSKKDVNRKIIRGVGTTAINVATGKKSPNNQASFQTMTQFISNFGLDLPFERLQETQADKEGLYLMAKAGFNPLASLDFWKKMEQQDDRLKIEFLSTHPLYKNRRKIIANDLDEPLSIYLSQRGNKQCVF